MITYPIFSNFCKNIYVQCYRLHNFPSFRSSHWRCSVRNAVLRNFTKLTGKYRRQSHFFNKVAGWENFGSKSTLLIKLQDEATASDRVNHIISASVNIGLPLNIGRGVNIGCDMFLLKDVLIEVVLKRMKGC